VEEYCGDVTVQFHDEDFFIKVRHSLLDHYPVLLRQTITHEPQRITDQSGHDVRLFICDAVRALVVSDDGALSWAMRDFAVICRDLATGTRVHAHPEQLIVSEREVEFSNRQVGYTAPIYHRRSEP